MQIDIDSLFTFLIIGATLLSFASSIGRSAAESRRKGRERLERQRGDRERDLAERERDPERRTYQAYLERSRQPDEARPGPAVAPVLTDEQERLRRETARKMGRTLAEDLSGAPSRAPQARTFAGDTRASLPGGAAPAPRLAPVFPGPASLETRTLETRTLEGGSIEVRGPEQPAFPPGRPDPSRPGSERVVIVPASPGGIVHRLTVGDETALDRRERAAAARRPAPPAVTVGRSTSLIDTRDMVRAIVMAEVLGPPVSRRRRAPRPPS